MEKTESLEISRRDEEYLAVYARLFDLVARAYGLPLSLLVEESSRPHAYVMAATNAGLFGGQVSRGLRGGFRGAYGV